MATFSRSNKVILADSQEMLRGFTVNAVTMAEDLRIVAHCSDPDGLYKAIANFPGSIVLVAACLHPDLIRLQILLETTNSRGIAILENNDAAGEYLQMGFSGVVFRRDSARTLMECVRRVAVGDFWAPPQLMEPKPTEEAMVGTHRRDRLTSNEMRLLSRVALGLCTRIRFGVGERMRPFGTG